MLEELLSKAKPKSILIVLLAAIGIISIWRGIWNLLDMYLIPSNFLYSQIISIIIGMLIIFIASKLK